MLDGGLYNLLSNRHAGQSAEEQQQILDMYGELKNQGMISGRMTDADSINALQRLNEEYKRYNEAANIGIGRTDKVIKRG